MCPQLDPESIDLATLSASLRRACGPALAGAVVGRTRIRDEVVHQLCCSELEGELLVDTMIGRGFIRRREHSGGQIEWLIAD
jgi:hypothetical protein